MVDVTEKDVTKRTAVAGCLVRMTTRTRDLVVSGGLPKGDALQVARVAGIMAAKRTSDLIPLCHPIAIGAVEVNVEPRAEGFSILARVATADRTGVEMEALTAAAVAALSLYDMVKGTERSVRITDLGLLEKTGGRSGDWRSDEVGAPPND